MSSSRSGRLSRLQLSSQAHPKAQFVNVVVDMFNGGDLVDGLNTHRRAESLVFLLQCEAMMEGVQLLTQAVATSHMPRKTRLAM